MNFKKRVNGSWVDTPHYIHNTSTDTITTLPADLYADGNNATVGLKGNMSQTGTPTPDNPIMPEGTGDRTEQLFDENYPNIKVDTPTYRSIYVGDGTFTLSTTTVQYGGSADLFFLAGKVGSGASTRNNGVWNGNPRTVTAVDGYVTIAYRYYTNSEESDPRSNDVMLNAGSTALPYEQFGYKIPISSANTTTPVYLGNVQTTRYVKKLVLDGTESWKIDATNNIFFYVNHLVDNVRQINGFCSHFRCFIVTPSNTANGVCVTANGAVRLRYSEYNTVDDFKSFLAQQYANGTPVTVWYVLATPTTGIVNEPLRKIGNYADEVSGITIPTIAGANTISVDTTLQPSEVTVNYKGWHPVADVHERESGAWD